MDNHENLDRLLQDFKQECSKKRIDVCPEFAHFYIHLLKRDAQDGLKMHKLGSCLVASFVGNAINKFTDPLDPTVCNMKMTFFLEHCPKLDFEVFKKQYTEKHFAKMGPLIEDILLYPENSNEIQLEHMFTKMQAFIIAYYMLGCPKNHVLLKQTRQSLNSVIARADLKYLVLKIRQHRLEYLMRLAEITCGILVYNNHGPEGDKENMQDIIPELQTARKNTHESLDTELKHCIEFKKYGFKVISEIVELDTKRKKANCHYSFDIMYKINRFTALYCAHERFLRKLIDIFKKTEHRIELSLNKYRCVIDKVNEALKYRTAVNSELVFPHFSQLSEIWFELVLYINHLTAINQVKEKLDEIMVPQLNDVFAEHLQNVEIVSVQMKYSIEPSFAQLEERSRKRFGRGCLAKIGDNLKCYCALTIALTGGLLVPAAIQKKMSDNLNVKFGFANLEFAKYAERNIEDFMFMLQSVIFTSVDLLVLFDLHNEILKQDLDNKPVEQQSKTKNSETQTEMILPSDLSPANNINTTWNIWDYHRETIRLANLRQLQTHSAQTVVSYGQRNAQNQSDDRRPNV